MYKHKTQETKTNKYLCNLLLHKTLILVRFFRFPVQFYLFGFAASRPALVRLLLHTTHVTCCRKADRGCCRFQETLYHKTKPYRVFELLQRLQKYKV
jgi:hypothetical protein